MLGTQPKYRYLQKHNGQVQVDNLVLMEFGAIPQFHYLHKHNEPSSTEKRDGVIIDFILTFLPIRAVLSANSRHAEVAYPP